MSDERLVIIHGDNPTTFVLVHEGEEFAFDIFDFIRAFHLPRLIARADEGPFSAWPTDLRLETAQAYVDKVRGEVALEWIIGRHQN